MWYVGMLMPAENLVSNRLFEVFLCWLQTFVLTIFALNIVSDQNIVYVIIVRNCFLFFGVLLKNKIHINFFCVKPSCFYNGCRYCWLIQSLLSDDCCDVIQIQIVNSILQFFSIFFRMQFHLIGEFFLVKVCDVLLSLWVESTAVS